MTYQGADYSIESNGGRSRLRLDLANLTNEQAWALLRLRDLFADPAKAGLLVRWLDGRSYLRYDPEAGLLQHVPAMPEIPPALN